MRIALDAMGTDEAPSSEVGGAVEALEQYDDLTIVLVGPEEALDAELARRGANGDRVEIAHAPERILIDDPPASAVRRKPRSSVAVGLNLQRDGHVDAFVSAGSTGAVMAASLIILRPLPGVDRPTVGTLLPTAKGPIVMLDAGANVDCKPHHLLQFARLGHVYFHDLMGVERPRVGLLNVGTEPGKGNELAQETYRLLLDTDLNFVGNVEGRQIIQGECEVVVCDGFVGNVLLKFYESVASFIIALLREDMGTSELDLERTFRLLDYAEYGGAPLLGVNGVSIICHGESTPKAIRNALGVARRAVKTQMVTHIARELAEPR